MFQPVEEKRPASVRQRQRRSASVQRKENPASPKADSPKAKPALLDSTNSPTHTIKESPSSRKSKSESKQRDVPDSASRLSAESGSKGSDDTGVTGSRRSAHSRRSEEKGSAMDDAKPKSSSLQKTKEATGLLSPSHKPKLETASRLEKQHTFENPGSPPPKTTENLEESTNAPK